MPRRNPDREDLSRKRRLSALRRIIGLVQGLPRTRGAPFTLPKMSDWAILGLTTTSIRKMWNYVSQRRFTPDPQQFAGTAPVRLIEGHISYNLGLLI
jgi:hypothetical protein